jgi:hypothetical protein
VSALRRNGDRIGCRGEVRGGLQVVVSEGCCVTVLAAFGLLVLFFSCLLAVLYDVDCLVEESLLDELWDDEMEQAA